MPRRGKFDWAQLAASGLGGFLEGHRAGLHDTVLMQRTQMQREEYDRRAQAAAVEEARKETLRGAFKRAWQVKNQALEVEKTRLSGMPIYERQQAEERIAKRDQDMQLAGAVIESLPLDGTGDIAFALKELEGLATHEAITEQYARADIEMNAAMGTEDAPGFVPEDAGKFYLDGMREGTFTPDEVLQYVNQARRMKAEQDAMMLGRDDVLAAAGEIRQMAPIGKKRERVDRMASQYANGLYPKIDAEEMEALLRVAASVDDEWADLILGPYGFDLAQPEQQRAPMQQPAAPTPQARPNVVQDVLAAIKASPDAPLTEVFEGLGLDPNTLSPEEVTALKEALAGAE